MATNNTWNNTITNATITLNSTTNAINISSDASATAVNIGTGGAAKTVTIGSTDTTSSLALQYGTSDFTVASASGTVMNVLDTGEITKPLQPAFLGYLASSDTNETGAGTEYQLGTAALTEVYDQGSDFNVNGTFTAPSTGIYVLNSTIGIIGLTIADKFYNSIITSNATYKINWARAASNKTTRVSGMCYADMDAADTATTTITVTGEAADTADVYGGSRTNGGSWFAGYLAL